MEGRTTGQELPRRWPRQTEVRDGRLLPVEVSRPLKRPTTSEPMSALGGKADIAGCLGSSGQQANTGHDYTNDEEYSECVPSDFQPDQHQSQALTEQQET